MRVAISGKGGAGKSLISATVARMLARQGKRVLALDTDTMPGMARSLGMEESTSPPLRDAAERVEGVGWRLKPGIGPVTAVRRYARTGPDGVLLLQVGKSGHEGMEGFQSSTLAYWILVRRLLEPKTFRDWALVADTSAGVRHIAADFAPFADTCVVVAEAGWQSVLTARRVVKIARMREARVLLVANKVRDASDLRLIEERVREPVVATIPFDADIKEAERLGVPLIDHAPHCQGALAIERLIEIIEAPG